LLAGKRGGQRRREVCGAGRPAVLILINSRPPFFPQLFFEYKSSLTV